MSYNGSGVFVRLYNWVNDAAANIKIRADRMDAEFNGIATGLTNCITKDGQTTITANLPMAGYRHTGVGDALLNDQYAALGQVNTLISTATGAITFNGLSDVVITSAASGDFVYYNGTNWINVVKSAVPVDGLQATGSGGLSLKNSGGTSVLTIGAGAGTGATFAGGVVATGNIQVSGTSSSPAYIALAEDTDNGTNKATLIAPSSIASDYTLTLPSAAGTLLTVGSQSEIEAETSGKGMDGENAKYHPAMPKAWVNFNGTGTVAIRASYNISSITDNGTGNYTVNLTNALSSANYCVNVSASQSTTAASTGAAAKVDNLATGSFRIQTSADGSSASTLFDNAQVMATVWGDFA